MRHVQITKSDSGGGCPEQRSGRLYFYLHRRSYTRQYESTCDRWQHRAGSGGSPAAARCWPRGAADRPPGRSFAVYIERAGYGVSKVQKNVTMLRSSLPSGCWPATDCRRRETLILWGGHLILTRLGGNRFVECALDAGGTTDDLCRAVDQVVHVEPALGQSGEDGGIGLLDACTRCTYNLFNSVAANGVRRVVLLSSMAIFEAYAPDIAVRADFEPRPTSDLSQLAPHLAEFGAREFALSGATRVTAARLGSLVDTASVSPPKPHRWWVTIEDVSNIVGLLVDQPLPSGFSPVYTYYDTVNIGRGDGRDVDVDGNDIHNWWRRPNGGNLEWQTQPPRLQQALSSSDTPRKILLFGGSGMLGPDIVRALSGDLLFPVSETL
eukprot:COSAG02_NODE_5160_length_4581_cov_97.919232_2_plen_381_part_00